MHAPSFRMIKRWIEDKYVYRRFREELHTSVKGLSPRHLMPTNSTFTAAPQLELVNEHGRTASLMEVPSLGAVADNRSPLRRTHSRSKSYAGHEKTVNEVLLDPSLADVASLSHLKLASVCSLMYHA